MKVVTINDWKCRPVPEARIALPYARYLTAVEAKRARAGFKPMDMGDKWFMVFDEGQLLFYRSWTGTCIFGVGMTILPAGDARLADAWVTADPDVRVSRHPDRAYRDLSERVKVLVSDWLQQYKAAGPYSKWPEWPPDLDVHGI